MKTIIIFYFLRLIVLTIFTSLLSGCFSAGAGLSGAGASEAVENGVAVKHEAVIKSPSGKETAQDDKKDLVEPLEIKPDEIYYFEGISKKFGVYQNRIEIYRNKDGEDYYILRTNRQPLKKEAQRPVTDYREGTLKIENNIGKGTLTGDTSETGWCEVTMTFSADSIKLQTGKCDLELPASGIYTKNKPIKPENIAEKFMTPL